ncbi:hypothetical protein [Roseiconus nitratireducens]|nr:hypothetical protein [Roseiconus nitratireducens]
MRVLPKTEGDEPNPVEGKNAANPPNRTFVGGRGQVTPRLPFAAESSPY